MDDDSATNEISTQNNNEFDASENKNIKNIKIKSYKELFDAIFLKSKNGEYVSIIKDKNSLIKLHEYLYDKNTPLSEVKDILINLKNIYLNYPDVIPLIIQKIYVKKIYEFILNQYFSYVIESINDEYDEDYKQLLLSFIEILIKNIICPKNIYEKVYSFLSNNFHLSENEKLKLNEKQLINILDLLKILYGKSSIKVSDQLPKNYIIHNGKGEFLLDINNFKKTFLKSFSISFWFYLKYDEEKMFNENLFDKNTMSVLIKIQLNQTFKLTLNSTYKNLLFNIDEELVTKKEVKTNAWYYINFTLDKGNSFIYFYLSESFNIKNPVISGQIPLNNKFDFEDVKSISLYQNFYGLSSSIIILSHRNSESDLKYIKDFVCNKIFQNNIFWSGVYSPKLFRELKEMLIEEKNIKLIAFYSPCYSNFKKNKGIILEDLINKYNIQLIKYQNPGMPAIQKKNSFLYNYVHFYKPNYKYIYTLGGINCLLPIMELMYAYQNDLLTQNTFNSYINLIQIIICNSKYNFYDANINHFFDSLSIFLERIPNKLYTQFILDEFMRIQMLYLVFNESKIYDKKSISFNRAIYLNPKIVFKFSGSKKLDFVTDFSNKVLESFISKKKKQKFINYSNCLKFFNLKILSYLLLKYDKQKLNKNCCTYHKEMIKDNKIEETNNPSIESDLDNSVNLFNNLLLCDKKENLKMFISILPLCLSPCLQIFILKRLQYLFNELFLMNYNIEEKDIDELLNYLTINQFRELLMFVYQTGLIDIKVNILKLVFIIENKYDNYFWGYNKFILSYILPIKEVRYQEKAENKKRSEQNDYKLCDEFNKYKKNYLITNNIQLNSATTKICNYFSNNYFYNYDNVTKHLLYMYKELIDLLNFYSLKQNSNLSDKILSCIIQYIVQLDQIYFTNLFLQNINEWINKSPSDYHCLIKSNLLINFLLDTLYHFSNMKQEKILFLLNNSMYNVDIEKMNIFSEIKNNCLSLIVSIFSLLFQRDIELTYFINIVDHLLLWIQYKKCLIYSSQNGELNNEKFILFIKESLLNRIIFKYTEIMDINISKKENDIDKLLSDKTENTVKLNGLVICKITYFFKILFGLYIHFNYYEDILRYNDFIFEFNGSEYLLNTFLHFEKQYSDYKKTNANIEGHTINIFNLLDIVIETFKKLNNFNEVFESKIFNFINNNLISDIDLLINKYINSKQPKTENKIELYIYTFFMIDSEDNQENNEYFTDKKDDNEVKIKKNKKVKKEKKEKNDKTKILIENENKKKHFSLLKLTTLCYIAKINYDIKEELINNFLKFIFYIILSNIKINQNYSNVEEQTIKIINENIFDCLHFSFCYLINKYYFLKINNKELEKSIIKNNLNVLFYFTSKVISYSKGIIFTANHTLIKSTQLFILFNENFTDNKKSMLFIPKNFKDNNSFKAYNEIYENKQNLWKYNEKIKHENINFFQIEDIINNIFLNFVQIMDIIPTYDELDCKDNKLFNKLDLISNNNIFILENEKTKYENIYIKTMDTLKNILEIFYDVKISKKVKEQKIINNYKKIKKGLFSWNNLWSDKSIFYSSKNNNGSYLKQKLLNHYSSEMSKIILQPIIDIDYYLPESVNINKDAIFNVDDANDIMKYRINLDIRSILQAHKYKKIKNNNDIDYTKNVFYESFLSSKLDKFYIKYFTKDSNDNHIKRIETDETSKYFPCCLVKPAGHIKGELCILSSKLYFLYNQNVELSSKDADELNESFKTRDKLNNCYGSFIPKYKAKNNLTKVTIKTKNIKYIFTRKYYYLLNSFEIFTSKNKSYYLHFPTEKIMNIAFFQILMNIKGKQIKINQKDKDIVGCFSGFYYTEKKYMCFADIIKNWGKRKISTLEFIMWCNIFSNRSFNDLTQYPVYPWVIMDYSNEKIDINDKKIYRDFKLPVGMLKIEGNKENEERIKEYISLFEDMKHLQTIDKVNFENFCEDDQEEDAKSFNNKTSNSAENRKNSMNEEVKKKKFSIDSKLDSILLRKKTDKKEDSKESFIDNDQIPFVYGTHYSNPIYISQFLCRIFPYPFVILQLQGGNNIDIESRIFSSIEKSFIIAMTYKGDVHELIPEFYYLPEMFSNVNNLNLHNLNEVKLPNYCKNKNYLFVSKLRKALENDNCDIFYWLDLIFGYKQTGIESEKAYNVFVNSSYDNRINIKKCKNEKYLEIYMKLNETGKTPTQIMHEPFEQRKVNKSLFSNLLKGKLMSKTLTKKVLAVNEINQYLNILNVEFLENESFFFFLCNDYTLFNLKMDKLSNYSNTDINIMIFDENDILNFLQLGSCSSLFSISTCFHPIKYYKFISGDKEKVKNKNIDEKIIQDKKNSFSKSENSSNYNYIFVVGGFWNGELLILENKKLPNSNKMTRNYEIVVNPFDNSAITCIDIDQNKTYGFCGTKNGNVNIYKINDYLSWKFERYMTNLGEEISFINFSSALQILGVSTKKLINLYTYPSYKIVRSFKLDEDIPHYLFFFTLSMYPVPSVACYDVSQNLFYCYSINGTIIESDKNEQSNIQCHKNLDEVKDTFSKNELRVDKGVITAFCVYNDSFKNDYLIAGTETGFVKILKFPNMKLIRQVFVGSYPIQKLWINKNGTSIYVWGGANKGISAIVNSQVDNSN